MKKFILTAICLFWMGVSTPAQTTMQDWVRHDDSSGNTSGTKVWFSGAGIFHIDTYQTGTDVVPDMNLFAGSPYSGSTPRLLLEPNYGLATLMYNLDNFIVFSPSGINGSRWRAEGNLYLEISNGDYTGTIVGQFDKSETSNHTGLQLWDANSGTLKRVTVGAEDSCGTGYRCLKIAN